MYLQFLMLHACFIIDPTCFMCIFIQYLAFSGTKLLTRCHSASSCFLLFLCFRKVAQEIFTEFNGTKSRRPIFMKGRDCQKGTSGRPAKRPHMAQARAGPGPRLAYVWGRPAASDSTSSPINSTYREKPGGDEKIHEKFRSRRQRRTHLGRVLQLFPAPCRRENPSPEASTSPCLPPR